MKDRNGKKLRYGDVCVVHPTNDKYFIPQSVAELVVVRAISNHGSYPINCIEGFTNFVTGTDFSPSELEIIGDVR